MPLIADTTVRHAEVVGSMLRPEELIEARRRLRAGDMSRDDYRAIEDRAVDDAIRIQEEAGVDVVTDGEMRRDMFFDFFIGGMRGLSKETAYVAHFRGRTEAESNAIDIPFTVTEKVEPLPCPAIEEYVYVRDRTVKPVKVTLPCPTMMLEFWGKGSLPAYPDPLELLTDAAAAVEQWMRELAAAGCTYIQIDAPRLIDMYCDADVRAEYEDRGIPAQDLMDAATDAAAKLGALDLPGVTKAMHLCRGNGTQSWLAEGGYEEFSEHVFKRATGFDIYHMEYDDDRSGGFEPLANLPEDTVAILGLISSKWTRLEEPDVLKARIAEAAKFHPLDRLALATQCGFASGAETAAKRKITEETQREKLELVARVADEVWGDDRPAAD